jgi:multicomponent Na+:H+ antiporter subunit G
MIINSLIAICLLSGAFFMLVAAIGILKLPDLYQRLHASSKAATLGVALLLLGAALHSGNMGVVSRCLMAIVFFILTAPVGAHLITRAAYNNNEPLAKETLSDDWAEDRSQSMKK